MENISHFEIVAILICLAAFFSFINFKYLRLSSSVGLMILSIAFSLFLLAINTIGVPVNIAAKTFVAKIDFQETLMNGFLCFLIFAGALHVEASELLRQKWRIFLLSSASLLLSVFIIGSAIHFISQLLGFDIGIWSSLVFGALISPTDPIAVLSLLKSGKTSKLVQTLIAGESLFNDGFGVVAFFVLTKLAYTQEKLGVGDVISILLLEILGGLIAGFFLGGLANWILKKVDHYSIEVLITLAIVSGGYCLAQRLHISGVLAIVIVGLMVGNMGRKSSMSDKTRRRHDETWDMIDDVLNSVLFVIMGLKILVIPLDRNHVLISILAIPIILIARFLSAGIIIFMTHSEKQEASQNLIKALTWGGLRGGLSIALALSLPNSPFRELMITMTYFVVVFSFLGQAISFPWFLRRFPLPSDQ